MVQMKRSGTTVAFTAVAALLAIVSPAQAAGKPNLILIVSDDAGYADFGFQGGTQIPTPRLDALAAQGVRFTQAYTGRVCSPSRAQFLSGQYPGRFGYRGNNGNFFDRKYYPDGFRTEQQVLFDRMREAGYTVGAFGKWHVGAIEDEVRNGKVVRFGNRPPRQHVDEFVGLLGGSRNYFLGKEPAGWTPPGAPVEGNVMRRMRLLADGEVFNRPIELEGGAIHPEEDPNLAGVYVTDFLADVVSAYIARHSGDEQPFFAYLAFTAPHGPLQAKQSDLDDPRIATLQGKRKTYAAMMIAMDRAVGTVLDRLADPNGDGDESDSVTDNTLVVFLNDNGGPNIASDNGVLRGWKGSMWEGGVRVPMLMAGAGVRSEAKGTSYDHPITSADVLPTFWAAAGKKVSELKTDGVNLLPFVNGGDLKTPHDVIYHLFALRKGDFKIVYAGGKWRLFNLAKDIGETKNLAAEMPEKLDELLRTMTDLDVQMEKDCFGRYGSLEGVNRDTDHFLFAPAEAESPGGNLIANGGFEESEHGHDQEQDAVGVRYSELPHWTNGVGKQGAHGARSDEAATGKRRAMISHGQQPQQVTEHIIATGDVYSLAFAVGGFNQWDADDSLDVELLSVDASGDGEDDVLHRFTVTPKLGEYAKVEQTFTPVEDGDAVGRLLGIRFVSRSDEPGEWASVDDVVLSCKNDAPHPTLSLFSRANAWRSRENGRVVTMTPNDAYANAVLEFPSSGSGSYTVRNDMLRSTNQEFMANRLIFSGEPQGDGHNEATVTGMPILLTQSLFGQPAALELSACGVSVHKTQYNLALDLLLHGDLTIDGDGDQPFIVSGSLRDYRPARSVMKQGNCTVVLAGENEFSGKFVIADGTVRTDNPKALGAAAVLLGSGGRLEVDGPLHSGRSFEQMQGGALIVNLDAARPAGAQITIDGPARLAGRLVIKSDAERLLAERDSVELLRAASITGKFDEVEPAGKYEVIVEDSKVLLRTR